MIDPTQITYRNVRMADLPALEWQGEYQHYRRLYAEIYQSSQQGKALMWVAEHHSAGIIGQLFIQLNSARVDLADGSTRAYIYGFRIKPAYRNQGLGTYMMQTVERDLARRNFCWVTLNVAQNNPRARSLYEQLGYQVVDTDPGRWFYYDHLGNRQEVHEPAWRMQKMIRELAYCVNN